MPARINIKKVFTFLFWCMAGAGGVVLLVAAIRYRNNNVCKGYRITISGPAAAESTFIDRKGINDLLTAAGAGRGERKPIIAFDLRHLEAALLKNLWIKDAQLFFDNNGILQARIVEREPAIRIFTREGNSFYADSSGIQLPLQERLPARLPVFTGYPLPTLRLHGEDSALTAGMLRLGDFIRRDSFWTAQVAQIEITPAKTFELEPEVGDHRISFGDGNDIAAKFHRLLLFYKEVLSQTGMDKYARIDVSYAGQVIGIKKGSEGSRYDSLQGLDNIRQLIRSAQQLQPDTLRQQNIRPLEHSTQTEQNLGNYDLVPEPQQARPETQQTSPALLQTQAGANKPPSSIKTTKKK
jgi:cell division protein FtsQ